MEEVIQDGEKFFFKTSDAEIFMENGHMASADFARSGTSCVKLDSLNKYGINIRLEGLSERDYIQLSVWQKKGFPDGSLQAKLKGEYSSYHYRTFYEINDPGVDGWIQHQLAFTVGPGIQKIDINLFAGGNIAYFDDFSFTKLKSAPQNDLPLRLHLNIPDSSKRTLDTYIMHAVNYEAIPASDKQYVNAQILLENDTAETEMKLKGDWTDHLKQGKESYRIKIQSEHAFNGLKSFSIQHPRSRKYLDEWVIHKMADREDILTTSYDFINVSINDLDCGVYALEEHFDKQLLESRNRREGPILKFDESGYWAAIKNVDSFDSLKTIPFFQQSTESVFKQNRTRKSPQLSKQFEDGRNLLRLFKEGYLNIEEIFDINQLAEFYVLMELSGSDHGLRWHNRRFYFNPVTQKLEHIAYDILPYSHNRNFECHLMHKLTQPKRIHEYCFDNAIFFNSEFKSKYLYYLEQRTQPAYLDSIFAELEEELNVRLMAIEGETPGYVFKKELYYENAEFLRKQIPELSAVWDKKIQERSEFKDWKKEQNFRERPDDFFLKEVSLNAYLVKNKVGYNLIAENFHLNPIKLLAVKTNSKAHKLIVFEDPIELNGYNGIADTAIFGTLLKPKKLYFSIANNNNTIFSQKVIPWSRPQGKSTRSNLKSTFNSNAELFTIRGNELIFSGDVKINNLLYIPETYRVKIEPGTTIEFADGGGLVITNSLNAIGTEEKPITFYCTDSRSNGVTVLDGEEANLAYVNAKGLSNLNYGNWELTGAVSIYQTPTTMSFCTVVDNHCEDALNIIRSDFKIDHLKIEKTKSDGFDADFCTGILTESEFINTGNDCIDFSGSVVDIRNIAITNSGDKGISGGERSNLMLSEIEVNGAVTGIASKDGSQVQGKDISISNVEFGCAAFRKKPEYDKAEILLDVYKVQNAQQELLLGLGSVITLNGEESIGDTRVDVDSLYARFEK